MKTILKGKILQGICRVSEAEQRLTGSQQVKITESSYNKRTRLHEWHNGTEKMAVYNRIKRRLTIFKEAFLPHNNKLNILNHRDFEFEARLTLGTWDIADIKKLEAYMGQGLICRAVRKKGKRKGEEIFITKDNWHDFMIYN